MAELPTPAVVPAGHVVRIRLGGHTYTSAVMSPAEAREYCDVLTNEIVRASTGTGFVHFFTADGTTVKVKARSVSAVEYGRPRPVRENRGTTVVHNHFADSGSVSVAELVEMQRDPDPEHTAGCSCGARGDLDFILEHICPLERS